MKADSRSTLWRRELRGWCLRGSLCALPSFVWAGIVDFDRPGQILAMVLIIALFVAGFTRASVRLIESGRSRFSGALKSAAWIKVILSIGNIGWGVPDMWLGVVSISAIERLSGSGGDMPADGRYFPFGWTAAITTSQGLLTTLLIVLIGSGVLGWRWLLKRCARSSFAT